jgi:hypothetical protein
MSELTPAFLLEQVLIEEQELNILSEKWKKLIKAHLTEDERMQQIEAKRLYYKKSGRVDMLYELIEKLEME